MQIALLGSGMMGTAIAYDLCQNPEVEKVLVCDIDMTYAQQVADFVNSPKVVPTWVDVRNLPGTRQAIEGSRVIISAIHYQFNHDLSRLAIEMGAHFCDLGGNVDVVHQQLQLHEEAKQRGVTIIPDTGLAPGMVQVLVARAAARFDALEDVNIRVGGLPQNPKPPLNYKLVFSVEGLINEYVEDALVIRDGKVQRVPGMSELEELQFPAPFDRLEAFQTSGGTSTLPMTYYGKLRNLNYKTIRYPGHCQMMRTLISLGFCSSDPLAVNGRQVIPRHVTGRLLERALRDEDKDVVLVSVALKGMSSGRARTLSYRLIDFFDERTGLTAMMRGTGIPSAIIAQMLGDGRIEKRGVVPQELSVPPEPFVEELARRNFKLEEIWE